MALGERQKKILASIVQAYVQTGEPVGSKAVCQMLDNSLSSATIRNEMAVLVEEGYLEQPHTSAGRIPSHLGYRLYINEIMNQKPISQPNKDMIDMALSQSVSDPEKLLGDASKILSITTNLAAITTTPENKNVFVQSCQIVPTGRRTAMIFLITSAGVIKKNRLRCDFDFTGEVLRIVARLIQEKIVGVPLKNITRAYIQTLAVTIGSLAFVVSPILMAILETANDALIADVWMFGQANLLVFPEFTGENAKQIIEFLNKGQEVATLLNNVQNNGLSILIGSETAQPELQGSSLLIAKYSINEKPAGAIGIVGPTRMDYANTIATLEYLAGSVGNILTQLLSNEDSF